MNYVDINKKYTATVAEYMAKGYTINTRTMNGSQGDYAHIDLTDGTEVIRIMVDTFHEWTDISLDGLEIIVGRADSEVIPNCENDYRSASTWGSGARVPHGVGISGGQRPIYALLCPSDAFVCCKPCKFADLYGAI